MKQIRWWEENKSRQIAVQTAKLLSRGYFMIYSPSRPNRMNNTSIAFYLQKNLTNNPKLMSQKWPTHYNAHDVGVCHIDTRERKKLG